MDSLIQDLRYALRSLFRHPSFALAAIVTLALGIGATTAIFTVVNAVVLRPLAVERPDRLVAIINQYTTSPRPSLNVSAQDFDDWQAQSRSFRVMARYQGGETSIMLGNTADYGVVHLVSPGFFDALGVRVAAGRLLNADEEQPGGPLATVISDAFWNQRFNGDPQAIGATIKVDSRIFTIVGVLAPGLRFPARVDVFVPSWISPVRSTRGGHNYRAIARLNDGVTVEQARDEILAIAKRLEQEYPQTNTNKHANVVPLKDLVVGDSRPMFDMLLNASAVVLLIACANVANLLLARASARAREMAVRAAVGASRPRLVRQLLTESLLLGVISGLAGAWLARLGVVALMAMAPADLPRGDEIHVDSAALLFAVLVGLAASITFGLVPALQASRLQLSAGLREGGKGTSIGSRGVWVRNGFVVAEIAMAVVLVAGAALLARSLAALASVDMGFKPDRLVVLNTQFPIRTFEEAPSATAFYRDLLADVRALPGVDSAGGVTSMPTARRSNGTFTIEGSTALLPAGTKSPQAVFNVATPDYFRTLRVPVTRGRDFSAADTRDAPFVAIVNQALVRAAFGAEDPIGRRIQCGLDSREFMTIVGVVGDVRTTGPAIPAEPEILMPYEQHPGPATSLNLIVRSENLEPLALAETIRRVIARRSADVPVKVSTMEGRIETATATPRFRTFLVVVFAGVALMLAMAGVYSVMAYTVSQRIPELGVRIALGATPASIMRLILSQGAKLAAAGLALGLALSLLSTRMLEGLLFGVPPRDPLTLALVTVAIAVVMLLATYIPGRRAVRVDPIGALRAE
jgi:putative ABC transport system permease protein